MVDSDGQDAENENASLTHVKEEATTDNKSSPKEREDEEEGDDVTEERDNDESSNDAEGSKTTAATVEKKDDQQIKEDEEKRRKEEEERKIRWKDYPMKGITEPHDHDVLYGRGGGTNHHPGNKRYRKMVEDRKIDYVNSKRLDKPLVALDIIREWRNQDPPGRFLKLCEKTKKWNDVGDKKAREKTSQALREKAPLIRKHLEEERQAKERPDRDTSESEEESTTRNKSTRFAEGTNSHDGSREGGITKAVLARDHSLGREYFKPDEEMTLEGFSWQDPFKSGSSRELDGRVMSGGRTASQGNYEHMPPAAYPGPGYPVRYPSYGSMTGPPPTANPPPPPPPGAYVHMTSGDDRRLRYTSSGRFESWGVHPMPTFSGNSWGRDASGMEREHSLGQNPLPHASVVHPAPYTAFDSRGASGQWGPPHDHRVTSGQWGPPQPPNSYPPPVSPMYHYSGPPPPGAYPHPSREYSGNMPPQYPPPAHLRPPTSNASTPSSGPPSPRFEVNPTVASTWSGRTTEEIAKTWSGSSGEEADRYANAPPGVPSLAHDRPRQLSPHRARAIPNRNDYVPKPDHVKRATSHQNENIETKPDLKGPSVKRAALNRDNSTAANRLKEQYIPDFRRRTNNGFEQEMRMLSSNFEMSTINGSDDAGFAGVKPRPLSGEERTSTLDLIAMDLMVKPVSLSASNRSSTIEALALEALDDDFLRADDAIDAALVEVDLEKKMAIGRPPALTAADRLTTSDVYDLMVNEPIPDDDDALVSGKRQTL